jgi:DNA polymerase I-like protein with 3'-5' exonuclease and polymerase domains
MYRFLESDKYPGSFNPTELVNYPIQGLATGTIVPMMAGIVWNVIKGIPEFTTGVRFVNMVHDSLVFDVADNLMSDVITAVRGILENTPKYFEEYFKEPLPFKTFKVGCSVGTNWYNMEEI